MTMGAGLKHILQCLLLAAAASIMAHADARDVTPMRMQAVQSDWNAQTPPASGWVDVTLPDNWSARWPGFDGVVWYRLTWNQSAPLDDVALFVEYLTFAGEIRVNGVLLARDASLVEPLSRMWNVPRYWRLPSPVLHVGENTLLVRVSGLSQYQPGLGPLQVGPTKALHRDYEAAWWWRQRLGFVSLGVGITLGLFFLVLWLLRRSEVAYGWYGAQQLVWLPIAWNVVATSPWPFATTDPYQNVTEVAVPLFAGCWAMFVLRFCERRWPRREMTMWIVIAIASACIVLAPHSAKATVRDAVNALSLLVTSAADLLFLWFAWRGGRPDQRVLSLCAAAAFGAGVHDVLAVAGVIPDTTNYASMTVQLTVIGVALVLAWNFVRSLRRIEGFNVELQHSVEDARAELAGSLLRQHELELVQARLGERVNLAHDLHDGLGGMLIGNIAALEQAPENVSSRKMLGTLRELRDDLRLIIDTASAQHYGEHALTDLLAPLRHRMTRLFEAHDIDVRWNIRNLENVYLTTTQSLDLLRIVQEALTNVLKHASARQVEVDLLDVGDAITLEVRDDGRGIHSPDAGEGTGMRSMHARARRLGATLSVGSETGATIVRLHMPRTTAAETRSA
jgi:signal transduction histidine kinase